MKNKLKIVFAVAILALALLACGESGNATSNTGSAVTPQASSTTSAAPKAFKVGDLVKLDNWQVKVNSVKTSTGGQFTSPKTGNIYLEVSVTLQNLSSETQDVSSLISFKLADSTGQSYTETVVEGAPNTPDGKVTANGKITGTLAYEVPKTMKSFSLSFTPDLTSTDQATWNLSV